MPPSNLPRSLPRAEAVVIGASAGGVHALLGLLGALPAGYALPIIVVIHVPPDRDSVLAEVFSRRTRLRAQEARMGASIEAGTVYFAPAGYHLLVEPDRQFSLSCDAPEHFSRPSIDVLFESAADAYGSALVAILLTGANEDGAEGLAYVKQSGGTTVVQDPLDAQFGQMPQAALDRAPADFVLNLDGVNALLLQLNH